MKERDTELKRIYVEQQARITRKLLRRPNLTDLAHEFKHVLVAKLHRWFPPKD